MMTMKKTLLLFALVLIVALVIAGCATTATDNGAGNTDDSSGAGTESQASATDTAAKDGEGKIGDAYVKIVSAAKSKDYNGKAAVVVTYEYTNQGDDAKAFIFAVGSKVFQGGVECPLGIMIDGYDSQNSTTEIKKDAVLTVTLGYLLQDDSSPVDVELTKFITLDKKPIVSKTFNL